VTTLEAFVAGACAGSLVKLSELGLHVELRRDQAGEYLPEVRVVSRVTGERVCVRIAEEP
jgi:hypothetical protein